MNNIPDRIHCFNVYSQGTKLIGISDEITLPDFEAVTETFREPGILGELESVALGQFSNIEMEVPFRQMDKEMFKLVNRNTAVDLTLRGSVQYTVGSTCEADFKPMRIVIRGKNKGITGGKMKQGTGTGSSIKIAVYYILIEIDGEAEIELDKLNFVYKVNGKDLLKKVRKMC